MRVLVTGATGFIGSRVARALLARGHHVTGAVRARPARCPAGMAWLECDFSDPPSSAWWAARLAGFDAVVNAVGILRENGSQTFDALHRRAPAAMFDGCAAAGVPTVVQVSALGADDAAVSRYHLTKKAADDHFRALGLKGGIVQPSLVYGRGGASAGLFDTLALMPLVLMPQRGGMQVQPVHLDDVVAGIVALVEAPGAAGETISFVGPRAMTMRDFLGELRAGLGTRSRLRMGPYPTPLFLAVATLAGHFASSPLDAETAGMLLRGNVGPVEPFRALLGHEPRDPREFIPASEAAGVRSATLLKFALPALHLALAIFWIWTGIVSFGLYPEADSLALLARTGLSGTPAEIALHCAAVLDVLFGVLIFVVPVRRRGPLWLSQLVLIAGYTALITVFLPEYWLHPFGPISKNLPIMAAIAIAWALEPPPSGR